MSVIVQMLAVAAIGCAAPQSQTDMNICSDRGASRADAAMNVQWRNTLAAMHKEDVDARGDRSRAAGPGYANALLASQRTWLAYRDAQCRMEGYAAKGGSMQPMLVAQCLDRLTRERTDRLARFAKDG